MSNEHEYLEAVAKSLDYAYAEGANLNTVEYNGEIFKRYLKKGSRILELGPAEGTMTDILYPLFSEDYTVVDAVTSYIERLKKKHSGIKGEAALFEEYEPGELFDSIVLGHVLEHVDNPVEILKKCRAWLKPGGQIMLSVPNCDSIHRQAAVLMGLQSTVKDLSEMDKTHGHRRVYSRQELAEDFERAGFHIIKMGGYWLKPLSNAQLEASWTKEMMDAFMILGEQYPDIAAEIYVVAE
ncbi:class I SAM-dependent methyltransferase [Lachnospiraceae bacterium 47-T17]